MITPPLPRAAIAAVLRTAGAWAYGRTPDDSADQWLTYGFSPSDVTAWIGARCWRPAAARALAAAGLTPAQASLRVMDSWIGPTSLGQLTSAGSLTATEAAALVRSGKAKP